MVKGIMQNDLDPLSSLTNEQLLARVKSLAESERDATASLLASLAELDARKAYLGEGYPSFFAYCTQALHFSEDAAYNRMKAARAARKWPVIFQMIADGSVTLTSVRLLADSLTDANHQQILAAARHRSKREVEQMIASLHPQPPVPSTVRRLPAPKDPAPAASADGTMPTRAAQFALNPVPAEADRVPQAVLPCRLTVVAPLAPERYKVQITISRETHDKLRRVQDLLRHQLPDGDPAVVFDRALTVLPLRKFATLTVYYSAVPTSVFECF